MIEVCLQEKTEVKLLRSEKKRRDMVVRMTKKNSIIFQNIPSQSIQKTISRYVISGSLHQGDARFLYPGVQCTFLSLWALVLIENKSPHLWNTTDINGCIIDGNERFLEHCFQYANSTEAVTREGVATNQ